jgi:hypothetical protein
MLRIADDAICAQLARRVCSFVARGTSLYRGWLVFVGPCGPLSLPPLQVTRVLTPEEEEAIKKQIWVIDGQNRVLEKLLGRRKKKKSFEYEIK